MVEYRILSRSRKFKLAFFLLVKRLPYTAFPSASTCQFHDDAPLCGSKTVASDQALFARRAVKPAKVATEHVTVRDDRGRDRLNLGRSGCT